MIKIIDYKAGNAPSVLHAVQRIGFPAELITAPQGLKNASFIILPGVGSAGATMKSLKESGIKDALHEYVIEKKIPFLGICVGLQIIFEHSEEDDAVCFAWLKGRVKKYNPNKVRVPQMCWNRVSFIKNYPVNAFSGITESYFYFVNSYYALPEDSNDIWGTAHYEADFTAAVRHGNIYGTQFHIEKSGIAGLMLLEGFLRDADKTAHSLL